MSPITTTSGTKGAPPANLPPDLRQPELAEPPERREPELTGRQSKPLLPMAQNRNGQLIILAAIVIVLIVLVIIFR